jgi:hypothetical protein
MYTNELLEEKHKAQKELYKKAQNTKQDYFDVIKQEAEKLYQEKGWVIEYNTPNNQKP